jgi:hypothetical protein
MTNMHPPGQRGEEFGSEQRVLHLATVSKKGAVQSTRSNQMQHGATRNLIFSMTQRMQPNATRNRFFTDVDCAPKMRQPEMQHFSLNGECLWQKRLGTIDGIPSE